MPVHPATRHAAVAASPRRSRPDVRSASRAGVPARVLGLGRTLQVGSSGRAVLALKQALHGQRYLVDHGSTFTAATRDAVMAFQKVNRLQRDGVAGPATHAALRAPRKPQLATGKADRLEVDRGDQVLYVVKRGRIAYIVNASTGNPAVRDGLETPLGRWNVYRKVNGMDRSPLGQLYKPSYYHRGFAVHGSASVPAYPASHGCVRVPNWAATRVYRDAAVGRQVVVHA